ncbi:tetratricopeptide repeat protein [Algoriphagus resistens]|uniref:tetratricopeptide repeat protein n=1 Tax=Algoriphagus resistens TaxID=1750590 RepID=UPI000716AAF0|nr:tetratricopeptide repeat protein [Algoriphagus resistens]
MIKVIQNIKSASKARELLEEQKFYDCIELCNTQIESSPNDYYSFYYRGQCKTHLKLYDEAIEDFEKALVNADKNVFQKLMLEEKQKIEVLIANIYRRQRKTDKALERLEKLINDHPQFSGGYAEKAGILSDQGHFQLALDYINMSIKHSPKDKKLIVFRAELIKFITS